MEEEGMGTGERRVKQREETTTFSNALRGL